MALLPAALLAAFAPIWVACAGGTDSPPRVERFAAAGTPGGCAWYGDADDRTLYFGQSAFWSAMRSARGDPLADLSRSGPKRIGRFELGPERMAEPLELEAGAGSGVWDVLVRQGRVYFTTFFDAAGFVDTATGEVERFHELGAGLNELAPGPGQTLLASRYGASLGGSGSVVLIGANGALVAEYPLAAPEGFVAAPKTVAFDPVRREIWVTVDLVPQGGGPTRQDARRLAADGRELARIEEPEIQFVVFGADGTGYLAARSGRELALLVLEPLAVRGDPLLSARRIPLDAGFEHGFDFVQDIHPAADGRVVLARWSGAVHLVEPDTGRAVTLRLPREGGQGLYYSAVLADGRLCATYCAGVEVVCTAAPPRARRKGGLR